MSDRAPWIPRASTALLVVGLLLLGLSWAVPESWWERQSWSAADAQAYSEASLDVHAKTGIRRERPNDAQANADLQKAQERLAQMSEQVKHAQTPRRRGRIAVRLLGLSLCVIGALLQRAFAEPSRS